MEVMAWNDIDPAAGSYDAYYAFDNVNVADSLGTIGVENDAGDKATQFAYNDFTPTNGLVMCLDYVGLAPTVITFDAVVNDDAPAGVLTNAVVHNTDNPGSKPATATADLTVETQSCGPIPTNLVHNGNFEEDQSGWLFYTNGAGSFSTTADAAVCDSAALVAITQPGSNVQLYQRGIALEGNTTYRLTFMAASPSGADMAVVMHNHLAPYQFYGLLVNSVDLTPDWQRYTVEFTTANFVGMVNDARLRFWFAPFARPGDAYLIDDVRVEKLDGTESALPQGITAAAAGAIDPALLDSLADGNPVDRESAAPPVYLPAVQN
jgi:hypothetical protein